MHLKINLASENQSCIFRSSVLRQYFRMHSYANGFFHPRSLTLIMTSYATYMTFCRAVIFFQIPVPGPTNCADFYVRLQTCPTYQFKQGRKMKLYIYHGLDNKNVPEDVTHVIIDNSVTIIKKMAFCGCVHLVSIIMGDNVKRIEEYAFCACRALRFVRLTNMLAYIGMGLSSIVILWRLCSSHRLSKRLKIKHSRTADH